MLVHVNHPARKHTLTTVTGGPVCHSDEALPNLFPMHVVLR